MFAVQWTDLHESFLYKQMTYWDEDTGDLEGGKFATVNVQSFGN